MHIPVLVNETVRLLDIKPKSTYIDATLGGAGYASEIINRMKTGVFIGIDADAAAVNRASDKLKQIKSDVDIRLVNDNFRNIRTIADTAGVCDIKGVVFDFGVSSFQLDDPSLGFSYMRNGPLDMRMNKNARVTAADIVNSRSQKELARIIGDYGEERWAARIAEFIVRYREEAPITMTRELVSVIEAAVPRGARRDGPHPAKRTFQALRIETNDELSAIREAITGAAQILTKGGVIVCVSFHSLEDRIVKEKFRELSAVCVCPPGMPVCVCERKALLKVITRKPVTPDRRETDNNPRARSAKLRAAVRLG